MACSHAISKVQIQRSYAKISAGLIASRPPVEKLPVSPLNIEKHAVTCMLSFCMLRSYAYISLGW
jgi:hypothetical protein